MTPGWNPESFRGANYSFRAHIAAFLCAMSNWRPSLYGVAPLVSYGPPFTPKLTLTRFSVRAYSEPAPCSNRAHDGFEYRPEHFSSFPRVFSGTDQRFLNPHFLNFL
jgi:hypothetical protein